jgi:hypothetical protein
VGPAHRAHTMSDPRPHGPKDTWDAFLSYNSKDREAVEAIALWLEDEGGVRLFFDRWRLVAGDASQEALEHALELSRVCVVCLGPSGLGPWQTKEVRVAIDRMVTQGALRIIPVILPGTDKPQDDMPSMLADRNWCDLRGDDAAHADGLHQLRAGIRNRPPGRRDVPHWMSIQLGGGVLSVPTGVGVLGDRVFVADHEEGRLIAVGPDGIVASVDGLDRPHHLIVHHETVIVCDTNAHRVVAFDSGLQRELWSRRRAGSVPLERPHGLCWDARHGLLVLNSDRHRLESLSMPGRRAQPLDHGDDLQLFIPCGIAASADKIVIANTYSHELLVLDRELQVKHRIGMLGYGEGRFAYPVGVACYHEHVVVADEHNQRLQVWRLPQDGDGAEVLCSSIAGEHIGSPFGVTFDRYGDLLVTDRERGRLIRIDFDAMLAELAP